MGTLARNGLMIRIFTFIKTQPENKNPHFIEQKSSMTMK